MDESKFLGLIIDVDADGKVKLPEDMMADLAIQKGGKVEVLANANYLFIRTATHFCPSCGGNKPTQKYGEDELCTECVEQIKKKYEDLMSNGAF